MTASTLEVSESISQVKTLKERLDKLNVTRIKNPKTQLSTFHMETFIRAVTRNEESTIQLLVEGLTPWLKESNFLRFMSFMKYAILARNVFAVAKLLTVWPDVTKWELVFAYEYASSPLILARQQGQLATPVYDLLLQHHASSELVDPESPPHKWISVKEYSKQYPKGEQRQCHEVDHIDFERAVRKGDMPTIRVLVKELEQVLARSWYLVDFDCFMEIAVKEGDAKIREEVIQILYKVNQARAEELQFQKVWRDFEKTKSARVLDDLALGKHILSKLIDQHLREKIKSILGQEKDVNLNILMDLNAKVKQLNSQGLRFVPEVTSEEITEKIEEIILMSERLKQKLFENYLSFRKEAFLKKELSMKKMLSDLNAMVQRTNDVPGAPMVTEFTEARILALIKKYFELDYIAKQTAKESEKVPKIKIPVGASFVPGFVVKQIQSQVEKYLGRTAFELTIKTEDTPKTAKPESKRLETKEKTETKQLSESSKLLSIGSESMGSSAGSAGSAGSSTSGLSLVPAEHDVVMLEEGDICDRETEAAMIASMKDEQAKVKSAEGKRMKSRQLK